MKLSRETIGILRNFSTINSNIVIDAGSTIKTISEAKNIFAKAEIEESFPSDFGIYDLNEFLSVLNLFDNPVLEFKGQQIVVQEEGKRRSVNYTPSDREILTYPQKDIKMPSTDVEFELTAGQIATLQKAASTLSVSDIVITAGESGAVVSVTDLDNPTSNSYQFEFEGTQVPEDAKIVFNINNLKLIAGDYNVSVSSKLIAEFAGQDATYYIALEKSSSF